jgi:hypothetical protein
VVAWGGAEDTLVATARRLAAGAEILTVIVGDEPPVDLEAVDLGLDGVELESHHGGQPNWWWLLAAQ